jgi:signal transduction histidine kinase
MNTPPERSPTGDRRPDPSISSGASALDATSAIQALAASGARPARLSHLIETIASQAARVFRGSAFVALAAGDDGLRVRRGEGVLADCEGETFPMTGSLAGAAASAARPRMVGALAADPEQFAEGAWADGPALAFPLTAESHAEGAVVVVRAPGEPAFTTADADAAALVGAVAGAFLVSAMRFADLRQRPRAALGSTPEDDLASAALRAAAATAFSVSPATGILRWCSNAAEVLGVPESELGATLKEWGENLEGGAETIATMIQGATEPLSLHLVHRGGDGRATLLLLRTNPSRGANGTSPQVVCTLQVSGREPVAEAGAGAGTALPMASMARALRHEINNSVGVIEAALQLLSREAAPMERATHFELINTGADRLRGLVSRLTRLEGDEGARPYVRDDGALGIR